MNSTISRRSILKGVAFAAPAIAIGASAPSALAAPKAATPTTIIEADFKADTRNDGGTGGAVSVPISNKTPTFFCNGVGIYIPNAATSVDLLIVKLVLPAKNATFDYAYGTESTTWSLPDGNSGKAKLADGSTGYLYEFVYEGPKLTGTGPIITAPLSVQVISGGGTLLGSTFGGQVEAIVNGKRQNRTNSTVSTIVRSGYSTNMAIGDTGVL